MRSVAWVRGCARALVAVWFVMAGCGQPKTPHSISITPDSAQIPLGLSEQLAATVMWNDGSTEDVTDRVTWTVADPSILLLSTTAGAGGVVAARRIGATDVTATLAGVTGTTHLTVGAATLQSIAVGPTNMGLALQTQQVYTATGLYSDGSKQDLTMLADWSCSDTNVATVTNEISSKGLVSAVAAGVAIINASYSGHTGSTALTVTPATLDSLQISAATLQVPLGASLQLDAIGLFSDHSSQTLTHSALWSSSNSAVAQVSNDAATKGLLTPVMPGVVTITATTQGVKTSQQITVTAAALTTLLVQPNGVQIVNGTTQQFKAFGIYSDGTKQEVTTQVTWNSDTPAVATVSNTGLVQALAPGQTKIAAALGTVHASTFAYVADATLTSVSVSPTTVTIPAGLGKAFKATAQYSNGVTRDVTAEATWSSSDSTLVVMSNDAGSSGQATSVSGAGDVTVTATLAGVSGTASLSVTAATMTALNVTPTVLSVPNGTSFQLTAIGEFSDRHQYDVTPFVTWVSSQPSMATVSNAQTSRGLLQALSVGTTSVVANFGSVSGSGSVTVTSAKLTSIDLTPKGASVGAGQVVTLKATGTFSDGSTQDLSRQVVWTSSDSSIVSVSNDTTTAGTATAIASGTATIYGALNGQTGSVNVTVSP